MNEPSLVRHALDELLRRHPSLDVIEVNWGVSLQEDERVGVRPSASPWLLVKLGQASEVLLGYPALDVHQFAIWKTTGALHTMNGGAVSDEPIWTPGV